MEKPKGVSTGGILQIRSNSIFGWKKKYFHLSEGRLSDAGDGKGKIVIDLQGCVVNPDYGLKKPYCFHIAHEQRGTHIFAAQSEAEMQEWLRYLRAASNGESVSSPHSSVRDKSESFSPILQQVELNPSSIEFGNSPNDILGKGASGVVRRGKWLGTTDVAIKMLNNVPEFIDPEELKAFYNEIELLSTLRHPAIVQLFGFTKKDGHVCLVTQFIPGGNLEKALRNNQLNLELPLLIEMALNIVSGMIFLHSRGVIHRDLKTGNILIENWNEGTVRVCDFGLSKIVQGDEITKTSNVYGTPAYSAPELPYPTHTYKVDVYSFAMILWEMVSRKTPWGELSHPYFIMEKVKAGERPVLDSKHPLYSIITKCWSANPDDRPPFSQVFKDLEKARQSSGLPRVDISQRSLLSKHSAEATSSTFLASPTFPNGPTRTPSMLKMGNAEEKLLSVFKTEQQVKWKTWSDIFFELSGSTQASETIKYLVEDAGMVKKASVQKLLMWFSPLTIEPQPRSYTVRDILEIVGARWFFGFMSASEARDKLRREGRDGSYLFRFSGTAGLYALSLLHNGQVSHCRIETERSENGLIFVINKRNYKSMNDIISVHTKEPLKIVSDTDSSVKVPLKEPVCRPEENYNVVNYGNMAIYNNIHH